MSTASRKKAQASTPNPIPKTPPHLPIRPGQSSPNSKDSTVPVTTPTANCTAMTADQRLARSSATGSLRRRPRWCITRVIRGSATPSGTRMMWEARVNAISCLAGSSWAGASASRVTVVCMLHAFAARDVQEPPGARPRPRDTAPVAPGSPQNHRRPGRARTAGPRCAVGPMFFPRSAQPAARRRLGNVPAAGQRPAKRPGNTEGQGVRQFHTAVPSCPRGPGLFAASSVRRRATPSHGRACH